MLPAFVEEREEFATAAPHLSYSRINKYLNCPEQYRLYYIENLRPRFAPANLVFGQIVHQGWRICSAARVTRYSSFLRSGT